MFPEAVPDHVYRYGTDANQFVHLHLPEKAERHPVIILVHGGCWREKYDLKLLGAMCEAFVREGFAVWNIEYRRSGNGGGWPRTFLDVARAVDMLRDIASEHALDLSRTRVVGHSAGGQLACWLAARHKLPVSSALYTENPLTIQHVIALAGIVDLIGAVREGICGEDLPFVLGGDASEVPDHYAQASPLALLPSGVRQTHIVGEADTGILANVRTYIHAAEMAGDDVRLIVVPEAGHFEIVTPFSPVWEIVLEAVVTS